ncbi:similar to gi/166989543/sp/A7EAE5.2/ATG12_SCLS1 RecName: Full=Autophagy-related protein 12; AltName: Full=Autophagy-related ubiquitin-like modifier atg12 [Plenodomus lingam JN3]|uniref:Ubiquitin-like protein ATG12 n=1 Tax=Leptosphaeria maculans (strain JN3 / isolate v23.1.3 / race Av1-4-5-6-7-8) TaxID=985895 RepID=E4ZK09_LEPMJ|nr:similar to gi/166989543/sp/A7EAE5.2/ATG12_SCLS1 RecName: Full=Autophagy-related protein 12; AltName: Full=Autophagy-related ubiquitin-like modifier atg12 [Plenodomus lingam JN3]CBX91604.1 similar to gi/166989543/sp/A7EAE5.2/ATG12_SCLS1 RecName: Full=Autophagy-related protein 12; AltName: Full=Autophagy-related ubiquitin-like modifier atg12 [Plenodomus lingam JN3]
MSDSPNERIPDEDSTTTDAPLTMAASVVLAQLPRDAARALEGAGGVGVEKVTIRLQPIGSAPHLTQRLFKLSTSQRFDTIPRFLRKRLGLAPHESLYCYVGSVFAPALDEGVGNLWAEMAM